MPVDVLRPIAMMAVGVDDGHPIDPIMLAQIFDHDGFDIDIAEAASAVNHPHGMVARGTHQRKPPFDPLFHHLDADLLGSPGADQVGLGNDPPFIGIAEMHPLDVFYRDQIGFVFNKPLDIEQPFFEDLVLGVEQPFFPFRVSIADGPVKGREKDQSRFHLGVEHDLVPPLRKRRWQRRVRRQSPDTPE